EAVAAAVERVVVGEREHVEAGVGERARGGGGRGVDVALVERRRARAVGDGRFVVGHGDVGGAHQIDGGAEWVEQAHHLGGGQREVDLGGVAGEEQRRFARRRRRAREDHGLG